MPTIPIYVRKDDYARFLEIYSPEWLHEILNHDFVPVTDPPIVATISDDDFKKVSKIFKEAKVPTHDREILPGSYPTKRLGDGPWTGPISKADSARKKK
jgi:hypothetical protein